MSLHRHARRTRIEFDGFPALSVLALGEGTPLLLLHGFTGDVRAWGDLPYRLARTHRVIVPDLPGHGESEAPHDSAAYTFDRLTEHLGRLMEEIAPGPAIWAGYSMGGRLALHAAASGAVQVRGLVLESASPGLDDPADRAARCESDEVWARQLDEDGITPFVNAWMRQPLFTSQDRLPSLVVDAERKRRCEADALAFAACLRGAGTGRQPSWWTALEELSVPALLLTGVLDEKFDGIADAMAQRWSGELARRARVKGAGHAVHLEKPEAWLAMVTPFLDTIAPQPEPADTADFTGDDELNEDSELNEDRERGAGDGVD